VTGPNELVLFMDDICIFMDYRFRTKEKGNITLTFRKPANSKEEVSKPILDISLAGKYCLILFEGVLQIFTICKYLYDLVDPQEMHICSRN
jgi:hypothetical protein